MFVFTLFYDTVGLFPGYICGSSEGIDRQYSAHVPVKLSREESTWRFWIISIPRGAGSPTRREAGVSAIALTAPVTGLRPRSTTGLPVGVTAPRRTARGPVVAVTLRTRGHTSGENGRESVRAAEPGSESAGIVGASNRSVAASSAARPLVDAPKGPALCSQEYWPGGP